ncbi:MAG TPA: L,D-transpeptidase family protein [Candidatus Acidoferrales bacterium]|nr:L,D-transpeptidase family protein [Candidatus Acidoferrales bacterium]
MPRPKQKHQKPRKKSGGGFFWLVLLIIIAGGIYFFWPHKHVKRVVAAQLAKPAASKPQSGPLVISQQSPSDFPRPVHDIFEAQIALARRGISPGSIDSAIGSQTHAAISVFQETENLPITGELDDATRAHLTLDSPILTNYVITTNDLDSLQPLGKTWLAKSEQSSLAYETELQLIAEKSHSHPLLIKRLNPDVNWTNITAGTVLKIPDVNYPDPDAKAAFVVIHLTDRYLEAFDDQTNLLLHFPCSIAAKVDKRPVGELHVVIVIQNPNYTVDPDLFPESDELQAIGHKLILPPGPKNPVGVAWMGLDKPGYGMHGTPNAELVGRTESHGCFRLANWDAAYLSQIVWVGMPVEVEL